MGTQPRGHQPRTPQKTRHIPIARVVIASIVALIFVTAAVVGIVIHLSSLFNILFFVFAILSPLLTLLQWFFPFSSNKPETPSADPPQVVIPSINVQVTSSTPSSNSPEKPAFRGIEGIPPLTNPRTIQQREHIVKEIFARLTQPDINAIALTGIGGVGKSTLAALIYHHVKEQQFAVNSPFTASPLWLRVDPAVTLSEILGNVCTEFHSDMPDINALSPQNQVVVLFQVLNSSVQRRLIVLDQFENLLDGDGRALANRPGIGEWLDALNSQPCICRVLFTSRPDPKGTHDDPPTYLQPYHVGGLTEAEGIELLRKRNVQASEEEMCIAIQRCNGHALALALLAVLLQKRNLKLNALLKDPQYTWLWTPKKLLDAIYKEQLYTLQRTLLAAFSVYREPVPFEAAQVVINAGGLSQKQSEDAIDGLLAQYLLQAIGEGCYQLHAIVAEYAKEHWVENNEQANRQALLAAHNRAAQYYLKRSETSCPPREKRRQVGDVHDLIEAIWQYCQAKLWPEAYNLIVQEEIFVDLKSWGGYATLLELYELMLPLDIWQPGDEQTVHIYNDLGRVYSDLENKKQALIYYEQALEISKKLSNSNERGRTLNNLGWIYAELENKERAQEYFEQALNINIETDDYRREASTLNGLGWLCDNQGKKGLARGYYERAIRIYREHKGRENLKGEGWTLNSLGKIYSDLGNGELAVAHFKQALEIRGDVLKNQWEEGRTLKNLGEIYMTLHQTKEALKCLEEALSISRKVGDRRGEGRALNGLGRIYSVLGDRSKALKYFEQALIIHREIGDRRHEARTLENQAVLFADLPEQQDQARQNYKAALDLYREIEDRWREGVVLKKIGVLCFRQGCYDVALACFLLAKSIFEEVQNPSGDEIQELVDGLVREVGEEQFAALSTRVMPRAREIVEQAFSECVGGAG
jgi:tetratricopeptide (TPR) repeat protein